MSFQNKGFWMVKGSGHISDRDTAIDIDDHNPPNIELKRSYQWFVDAAEGDFFPNKKQVVEDANRKSSSGFSNVNLSPWENKSQFHAVPNDGRLFGSDTRAGSFPEKNSYVQADDSNVRSKMITNQYVDNASFGLSISHSVEDPEAGLSFGGMKKVKVNQFKDSHGVRHPEGHNFNMQINGDFHQAYCRKVETRPVSIVQNFDKDDNVALMGLTYNRGDAHVRSYDTPFGKGDDTINSVGIDFYNKEDPNVISCVGFPDEHVIVSATRSAADYGQLYNQSSLHVSTAGHEKELDASKSEAGASNPQSSKVKSETSSKNKQESKANKKEAPNSFPSNVRSLLSTGIVDGVPVKYVSVAREELHGIIKGAGYLCGCHSCEYSKPLNAYEFERHAGCKSKHPNNHIYFENGKTIYQIVQELKSTPESKLFDTIQTVFGAPINQKAFRYWKESFQAASRELHRIYGKEELNQ